MRRIGGEKLPKWRTSTRMSILPLQPPHHRSPSIRESWHHLVELYSGLQLTYRKDRLMALEGLRVEYQRRRQDDVYVLGHWKSELPLSLCWTLFSDAKSSSMPLQIPSWS